MGQESEKSNDWWNDLSPDQKQAIERGLRDIDEGKIVSHDEVKKMYRL